MENNPILISALEHWSYCPRQCALIHQEEIFDENIFTLKGRMLHARVDKPEMVVEAGIRIEHALPLWSIRLGLVGKADVVEFHGSTPYPVEYKHGRRKTFGHEDLQLCAQALCLEEMLSVAVPRGAIYHHGSRRRREVVFDESLRRAVVEAVEAVRSLLARGQVPPPLNDARCTHCSLQDACMPSAVGERDRVRRLNFHLFEPES